VLSPKNSPLGKVLSQYVLVRIVRMDDVNVALFDRDWYNTLYFFALNADEQIYLRYGGRDARSPDSYLNLESIELAARQGLELHKLYREGKLPRKEPPKPLYPREIPMLVERTYARGQCVECHLIGDFQNLQRERDNTLDKLKHLFVAPDIRTIGIELDVPKGLLVRQATGAVEKAGMKAGDRISGLNGVPVWTFGDLQYEYDKVDRRARRIEISVDRSGEEARLKVDLPEKWWLTEIRYRQSSVDPRTFFEDRPLTAEEKRKFGLKPEGFASEVKYIPDFARTMKSHSLQLGDIVWAVDGTESDPDALTADLYIRLRRTPEDSVTLDVIRKGEKLKVPLKTFRLGFRK
jgi:hypothetical protein